MECLALSQQVLDLNQKDDVCFGTDFKSVDWKQEQMGEPTLARVIQLLQAGHKITDQQR